MLNSENNEKGEGELRHLFFWLTCFVLNSENNEKGDGELAPFFFFFFLVDLCCIKQ